MRELVTDLEKIRYWGHKNLDKNYNFRSFLKFNDFENIDEIVHKIENKIRNQIDCTTCGNCCIQKSPKLLKTDISRISKFIGLSENEFIENYIDSSEKVDIIFANRPCKFLNNCKCTIYDIRPKDCISYPHTQKKGFTSRLLGVIENYSICPIVFNLVEQLKIEYKFR